MSYDQSLNAKLPLQPLTNNSPNSYPSTISNISNSNHSECYSPLKPPDPNFNQLPQYRYLLNLKPIIQSPQGNQPQFFQIDHISPVNSSDYFQKPYITNPCTTSTTHSKPLLIPGKNHPKPLPFEPPDHHTLAPSFSFQPIHFTKLHPEQSPSFPKPIQTSTYSNDCLETHPCYNLVTTHSYKKGEQMSPTLYPPQQIQTTSMCCVQSVLCQNFKFPSLNFGDFRERGKNQPNSELKTKLSQEGNFTQRTEDPQKCRSCGKPTETHAEADPSP